MEEGEANVLEINFYVCWKYISMQLSMCRPFSNWTVTARGFVTDQCLTGTNRVSFILDVPRKYINPLVPSVQKMPISFN